MLREADSIDPFKKFKKAGNLAKTVAVWGSLAVKIQKIYTLQIGKLCTQHTIMYFWHP